MARALVERILYNIMQAILDRDAHPKWSRPLLQRFWDDMDAHCIKETGYPVTQVPDVPLSFSKISRDRYM